MTDDLRQRIADALTAAAYQCDGKCDLDERACYDAHPIIWSAMAGGTTHVDGSVTAIANTALTVVQPELDRLREYTAELEEQVIAMGGHQAAAEEHEAAIDRVRALHERREGDDGSTYCDVCSNHGDVTWPCATIAALDGREAGQ